MVNGLVTVRGKKYYVKNNELTIRFQKIRDITEIIGLEHVSNLQKLILDHNKIMEIKGLTHLKNLQELDLRFNEITEIKGLEHLTSLQKLYLKGNPIRTDETPLVDRSAQEVVIYCQEKARRLSGPVIPPVEVASSPMTSVGIKTSTPMKTCPSCGFSLEGDTMFCPNCGVEIVAGIKPSIPMKMCPSCGLPLEEDMLFCPNCGINLGKEG